MRDLSVTHVERIHERSEMASGIGRKVAHQTSTLIASIGGLMRFTEKSEEPQSSHRRRKSQPFVSCRCDNQHREQRSRDDNGDNGNHGRCFNDGSQFLNGRCCFLPVIGDEGLLHTNLNHLNRRSEEV